MIRDTQIQAYYEEVKPTLQKRQQDVMEVIKKYPEGITIFEVASLMNVLPHTISGRFGEMEKKKAIKVVGKKEVPGSHSNRKHSLWAIVIEHPEGKQTSINF